MTFLELRTKILGYLHRPASEMGSIVDFEINAALLQIQRWHEFKYVERLVEITYPASAQTLSLTGACEGTLRNLISAQALANTGANTGQVLKIVSYNTLMQRRLKYERNNTYNNSSPSLSHGEFVQEVRNYDLFLMNNEIGLYPTPSITVPLLLNLSIWLPALVDDSDSNFLTEVAYDFVVDKALSRLHYYLKDDERSEEFDKKIAEDFEALKQWDAQIRRVTDDE